MDRWLIHGIVVGVALVFTAVCMIAGGTVCAHLMWPGCAVAVYWFHARVLGGTFFPVSLAFNTLIYSAVFGLLLWRLRPILWKD